VNTHLAVNWVVEPEPCAENELCINNPVRQGDLRNCVDCKWTVAGGGIHNRWYPIEGKYRQHPQLEARKRQAGRERRQAAADARKQRNKSKIGIQAAARRAEQKTNSRIISATRNSGRSRNDADHVSAGRITLDTKLQSNAQNPVVKLDELEKVRADARRAGNPFGALVIRNKDNRAVVVFDEDDYAKLVALIGQP
jgi:hypothetical protein